jgi:hypothetical protein
MGREGRRAPSFRDVWPEPLALRCESLRRAEEACSQGRTDPTTGSFGLGLPDGASPTGAGLGASSCSRPVCPPVETTAVIPAGLLAELP